MLEATLSSKNQIVVPKEAREALGLKPGEKLLFIIRGKRIMLLQKPESHREAIRGLAKPYGEGYLKRERKSWR